MSTQTAETSSLIWQLYGEIDRSKGVKGDGWAMGLERTRDGLIHSSDSWRNFDQEPTGSLAEKALLEKINRFGFFSNASTAQQSRVAKLSRDPFKKIPSAKRATPPKKGQALLSTSRSLSATSTLSSVTSNDSFLIAADGPRSKKTEIDRIDKWADMLVVSRRDAGGNAVEWCLDPLWWVGRPANNHGAPTGSYRRMRRRVYKGIPDRWRRAAWSLQLEQAVTDYNRLGRGTPLPTTAALISDYARLISQPCSLDTQIDLDVPRTVPGNTFFKTRYGQGQRALFYVLHAVSLNCEKSIGGYCQGMAPIAATFLNYFEPERAFVAMVRLLDLYGVGSIFAPGFPGLNECFYVQESLLQYMLPGLYDVFRAAGLSSSLYATKWYITLFSNSFPFPTQARIWDAFLLDGIDTLVVVAVAIIWHFKREIAQIVSQHNGNAAGAFESVLTLLTSYYITQDDDALMRWVRKVMTLGPVREFMRACHKEWKDPGKETLLL